MKQLTYANGVYQTVPITPSRFARVFPSLTFYTKFFSTVLRASAQARRSRYDDGAWGQSSLKVLRALESVGVRFEISGIEHVEQLETPCVVVGNHVSTMETTVLPAMIQPIRKVTFIVKSSLLTYPIFGHVMRSRDPIAVSQTNPRQDFKTVMDEGMDRLKRRISMVVFPQGARTDLFDPASFNTIGVKLAQRANVPVVPLALATGAWGNGKIIKDLGKIDPTKKVHFAFGQPMWIEGRGTDENRAIIDFITTKLQAWKDETQ